MYTYGHNYGRACFAFKPHCVCAVVPLFSDLQPMERLGVLRLSSTDETKLRKREEYKILVDV